MELKIAEVINSIADFMKAEANTNTIVGEPFELGEFTCTPVIKVGMGFGTGGGELENSSKESSPLARVGIGAGMGISPIGFLVARGAEINFVPAQSDQGLVAVINQIPGFLKKLAERRKKEIVIDVNQEL